MLFDTLGSFWLKNSSDFGKVQFCPELSNFSQIYPILATGEDFSTIVWLLYKPCMYGLRFRNYDSFLKMIKNWLRYSRLKASLHFWRWVKTWIEIII